ncbi:tryptophan synthase beta subunit-like PLP-dependent enzyme [Cristinia sonorae]|uniref:L-serine ammonia-lyase n=1 Tax=Cristinia sonorae TaxID=1940300 RepID=A0A8K0XTD0_9AGAR|nr:tryptophan synthase beta subunit-like PLP-dependent enzyme [Cristinia sonorae]
MLKSCFAYSMQVNSADNASRMENMWLETPLVRSPHLSEQLGCNVYLKLENLQPSQSYKYRGISRFVQLAVESHGSRTHLMIASSGNAGLAAAMSAKALGVRCMVFLPEGASQRVLQIFQTQGADVRVHGKGYIDALKEATVAAESDPDAVLLPSYDHPVLWEGHASMIEEVSRQLPVNCKPDAIFCSVGGGGLAGGVITGCRSVGWDDVPLVTMETSGSNCFYQSVALNEGPFVNGPGDPPSGVPSQYNAKHDVTVARLSKITSMASSLGASSPAAAVVKMALTRKGRVKCVHADDTLAMQSCLRFADDHKMIVELACSVTLIPVYYPELFHRLIPGERVDGRVRTVVFIVCGGFTTSVNSLGEYRGIIEARNVQQCDVWCNGERWAISSI